MEQDHPRIAHAKYYSRNTPERQIAADFPKPVAKMSTERHSNGPSELDVFDILADNLPVGRGKSFEPFPDRLPPGWQGEECRRKSLHDPLCIKFGTYSKRHFIACGLIGEPVPPVMMSGGPQKKNS